MTRPDIEHAFSRAGEYDQHAVVQRNAADALAERIARSSVVQRNRGKVRLLEIGCGTGFLTQALIKRGLTGEWLVTDISNAMLDRCRQKIGRHSAIRFAILDGERLALPGPTQFDVICASFVFQWFRNPALSAQRICRHLAPNGILAFSTLLHGTFPEWSDAHRGAGLACGQPAWPDADAFETRCPPELCADVTVAEYTAQYPDGLAFLRSLKAIGAGAPRPGHRPLRPAELRTVLDRFDRGGARVTYRVGQVLWTAPEADFTHLEGTSMSNFAHARAMAR